MSRIYLQLYVKMYHQSECKHPMCIKKGLGKFPDNITKFVGNDFKDTYRKAVEWLKDNNKYM
jgi:hypothetical protein